MYVFNDTPPFQQPTQIIIELMILFTWSASSYLSIKNFFSWLIKKNNKKSFGKNKTLHKSNPSPYNLSPLHTVDAT